MLEPSTRRISGLAAIAGQYSFILCDVWGVLHNGEAVYRDAADALAAFRRQGGRVVLLTNSPRPHPGVIAQLRDLAVADDVYDAVVTSGDATRALIAQVSGPVFHLGPARDIPLFDGLDVEFADESSCAAVVCTGLFEDEVEQPDDYRQRLKKLVDLGVPMICANPDVIVERGNRMIYCAGSLANLYDELGGKTLVAGKPHAPIYDIAMNVMNDLEGSEVAKPDIIAIGDGMPTDVAGAQNNGFDLLYISAGIHHQHYGPPEDPDEAALLAFLEEQKARPNVWMPRLTWGRAA